MCYQLQFLYHSSANIVHTAQFTNNGSIYFSTMVIITLFLYSILYFWEELFHLLSSPTKWLQLMKALSYEDVGGINEMTYIKYLVQYLALGAVRRQQGKC